MDVTLFFMHAYENLLNFINLVDKKSERALSNFVRLSISGRQLRAVAIYLVLKTVILATKTV
jgi:hypothetical protein